MEFSHEFRVPADIETTFTTLSDLERVAPCMPGAQLDKVEGGSYHGRMKVKVGPVSIGYSGTADLVEVDEAEKRISIHAAGKEMKSSGKAEADVTAQLTADGDETVVSVVTNIDVTGNAATVGRSALPEVTGRIIQQFAKRLEGVLAADDAPGGDVEASSPVSPTSGAVVGSSGSAVTNGSSAPLDDDNSLDLWSVVGPTVMKRLVPIVGALGVAVIIWVCSRRRT